MSDPDSENYGKHLTIDQVNDLIQPTDESLNAVESWLSSNGVSKSQLTYSPAKDWIKVSLPVSKVETLLDTKYSVYQHSDGSKLIRTPQYSLPKDLHDAVEVVVPTNSFVTTKRAKSSHSPQSARKRAVPSAIKRSDAKNIAVDKTTAQTASIGAVNVSGVCTATHVTPTCLRTLYGTIHYTPQVPGKNKVGLADYLEEASAQTVRS